MVNVEIDGKTVELFYDTSSQFSIITRQTYNSLPCKLPLAEVKQSSFIYKGSSLSNLELQESDITDYPLTYEPILVSNHMKSNILGAKTESRFKLCTRCFELQTLVYTTTKNENVLVLCYKEQLIMTSAYIRGSSHIYNF